MYTVIALPGLGGTGKSFPLEAFDELYKAGFQVLFADYGDNVSSIELMAAAVWAAVASAEVSLPVFLLGYSMGGFVAQAMYKQSPLKVAGIILLSTTCFAIEDAIIGLLADHGALITRMVGSLAGKWPGEDGDPKVVSRQIFMQQLAAVVAHATANTAGGCDFLTACSVPVLAIYGSKDKVIHPGSMEKLRTLSSVKEVVFDGSGHGLVYEKPQEFGKAVTDWMQSVIAISPAPAPKAFILDM